MRLIDGWRPALSFTGKQKTKQKPVPRLKNMTAHPPRPLECSICWYIAIGEQIPSRGVSIECRRIKRNKYIISVRYLVRSWRAPSLGGVVEPFRLVGFYSVGEPKWQIWGNRSHDRLLAEIHFFKNRSNNFRWSWMGKIWGEKRTKNNWIKKF